MPDASLPGGPLGQALALGIYLLVVMGPLLALTGLTVRSLLGGQADELALVLPTGRRLELLANSLALSAAVAALVTVEGWLAATAIWAMARSRANALLFLVLPLAALPPYLYALAWFGLVRGLEPLLALLGLGAPAPYGWTGVLWVQGAAFAPLGLGFAWLGLRNLDPDLIDSGRTARHDAAVLARIALPMGAPALATGAGIVFLLSLLDYSVPSLFQVNVYPLEVFADYSATNSPERALLMTIPLLLIAGAAAASLLRPIRALTTRMTRAGRCWSSPPHWPVGLITLQWLALGLLSLQALAPLGVLLAQSGGLGGIGLSLASAWGDLRSSLWSAGLAGAMSALVGMGLARRLRNETGGGVWWLLAMAPLAIPASLAGLGFVVVTAPLEGSLRGALVLGPALVLFGRFVPLSALILLAQMRRLDPLLFESARLSESSAWRRAILVEIPLLGGALLAAAGLVFALSLGELGATLLAVPPGMGALSIRIYNYLHYGASETVAGLCLVLEICVLAAAVGTLALAARWERRIASGEAG